MSESTTSRLRVERAAYRVLCLLRGVAPNIGVSELKRSQVQAIASATHVRMERRTMGVPYVSTSFGSSAALGLAYDPDAVGLRLFTFLVISEAARRFLGPKADRRVVDTVALCATIPASSDKLGRRKVRRAARGELWKLRPVGWTEDHLPACLVRRARVLRKLECPDHSTEATVNAARADHGMSGAQRAVVAGRSLRDQTRYRLALRWFALARRIAEETADWEALALAWGGAGVTFKLRGRFPHARRCIRTEARICKAKGLRNEIKAYAVHDLASIAIEGGQSRRAERLVRLALCLYPESHPSRLRAAHDIAYHWLERGDFGSAHRAIQAVIPRVREIGAEDELMLVIANTARAAAGCGLRGEYLRARDVFQRFAATTHGPGMARAHLSLAYAAMNVSDYQAAEIAAAEALAQATRAGEFRVAATAEALLDAANAHGRVQWFAAPAPSSARLAEWIETVLTPA